MLIQFVMLERNVLVFPAASRPSMSNRISLDPKILPSIFDNCPPIVMYALPKQSLSRQYGRFRSLDGCSTGNTAERRVLRPCLPSYLRVTFQLRVNDLLCEAEEGLCDLVCKINRRRSGDAVLVKLVGAFQGADTTQFNFHLHKGVFPNF